MRAFGRLGRLGQLSTPSMPPDISSSIYSGAKSREPFYYQGRIALPVAPSGYVAIAQFTVPSARNGFLQRIAVDYIGAGFTEGSGALLYTIFRNGALTRAVKGFANLTASVGAVNAPLEIPPIQLYESEVISIAVNNVSLAVGGAQLVAAAIGWFYPRSEDTSTRWP